MAEQTLAVLPLFPNGTEVGLYDAEGYSAFGTIPPGPALATEIVVDGAVTFTGLTENHPYFAAAQVGGSWRAKRFIPDAKDPDSMKGPEGAQGPKGEPGAVGAKGATGATGPAGGVGPEGPKGPTGSEGSKGSTGPTGPEGPRGETGVQGPTSGGLILVRLATTAALEPVTAGVKTLEGTANGALPTIDQVAPAVGDKILIKNQEERRNGVYEVTSLGSAGSKWLLTRIASLDETAEFVQGMIFQVGAGTINGGTQWEYWSSAAIVVGTTAIKIRQAWAWEEIGGSGEAIGGEIRKVQARKDRFGYVRFRGVLKLSAAMAAADVNLGTLPLGWRPVSALGTPVEKFVVTFLSAANAFKQAFVEVKANGEVLLLHNANIEGQTVSALDMSPVHFFAGE
jgi:Collagen triple helix repeat (20 copies)